MKRRYTLLATVGVWFCTGCTLPRTALHREPLSATEYNTLGSAYLKNNEKAAAKRQFEAALRQDKKNFFALMALGNFAYEEKDYKHARRYFRRAVRVRPEDPSAINNLAMADLAEGKNLDRSRKNLEKALPASGEHRPYLEDTLAQIQKKQSSDLK
jgi:Tfp pilus assembly protein PilF